MTSGVEWIAQATLLEKDWYGPADPLHRGGATRLKRDRYEAWDLKLARRIREVRKTSMGFSLDSDMDDGSPTSPGGERAE